MDVFISRTIWPYALTWGYGERLIGQSEIVWRGNRPNTSSIRSGDWDPLGGHLLLKGHVDYDNFIASF